MNKISLFIVISLLSASMALYDANSKVVKLTSGNFREKVINSKELWFVEFYAPWCGHCQRLAPEWDKLAKALEGIIRVGGVDMDADREAGAPYGIQGFPTIKFFSNDKSKPLDYQGGRTANEMIDYAFQQAKNAANDRLKGKSGGQKQQQQQQQQQQHQGGSKGASDEAVVVLTDSNFDELVINSKDLWLVEFYAPWCGHCKRLEPEWNEAASQLLGQVKVGKVDATVEGALAQRFMVQGYPTIKMFPPGEKRDSSAENYEGGRDASSIVAFALQKADQYKLPAQIVQLLGTDQYEQYCVKHRGICLISFLPHILDSSADERNEFLDVLRDVAKSQRSNPVTFLWAQGGDHYQTEEALALGSGYPAMVAISVNKGKFTTLKGAFSKKNIDTFITALISGREALFNLPKLPTLKTAKEWDGKDAPRRNDDEF